MLIIIDVSVQVFNKVQKVPVCPLTQERQQSNFSVWYSHLSKEKGAKDKLILSTIGYHFDVQTTVQNIMRGRQTSQACD